MAAVVGSMLQATAEKALAPAAAVIDMSGNIAAGKFHYKINKPTLQTPRRPFLMQLHQQFIRTEIYVLAVHLGTAYLPGPAKLLIVQK